MTSRVLQLAALSLNDKSVKMKIPDWLRITRAIAHEKIITTFKNYLIRKYIKLVRPLKYTTLTQTYLIIIELIDFNRKYTNFLNRRITSDDCLFVRDNLPPFSRLQRLQISNVCKRLSVPPPNRKRKYTAKRSTVSSKRNK